MTKALYYVPLQHLLVDTDLLGLSSASEVFQKNNESVFEGIKGIHIVSDDIIIAGSSLQEHNQILRQVLERAKECNVRFNYDKLQLRVPEVKPLSQQME